MTTYTPPKLYFSPHIETIVPALFRRVRGVAYRRERLELDDGDFLDLDWLNEEKEHRPLAIICHGLEGDSERPYVKGMARAFSSNGYDVLAWNYRGCSGEMNRLPRFYHSGATDDLDRVVTHAISQGYNDIYIVGFSLGGNLTMKYLGEATRPAQVKAAVVFSVPLDLHASCLQISRRENWLYSQRFLGNLKEKIRKKALAVPGSMDVKSLRKISSLMEFDDTYTSVIHGFSNAEEYYYKCSSIRFANDIDRPVLLINAFNDPFLPEECYPVDFFKDHKFVVFQTPERGGHVGFTEISPEGLYWSESVAVDFIENHRANSMNNFLHS